MPEPSEFAEALGAIRGAFDRRAATYDEDAMHQAVALEVAAFADLDGVRDVLDVATGTGLVLRALHQRMPGLHLTGADLSPGMLAAAASALPEVRWVEADVAALPLPDASMDLILCVTALHIIPDLHGTVAEWHRMLRPGGRVVTATFLMGDDPTVLIDQPTPVRPYISDYTALRTLEAYTATFASSGFAVTRHTVWADAVDTVLVAELTAI
jgi:ubiquinone/menaquinone biosynthesis C-methylase UbiE